MKLKTQKEKGGQHLGRTDDEHYTLSHLLPKMPTDMRADFVN